jgi:hypothetical protein
VGRFLADGGSVSTVYVRELPRKQGKSNERHQSRFAQAVPHLGGGRSKPKTAHIATPDALLCKRLNCYRVAPQVCRLRFIGIQPS